MNKTRLRSLAATNFFGILNDNAFRFAMVYILTSTFTENQSLEFSNLVAALFTLPFVIFAIPAAWLSDRFEKTEIIRLTKLTELVIAILAVVGIYNAGTGWGDSLMYVVLVAFAIQSTFYIPARSSLIPQYFQGEDLLEANGFVELLGFIAIIGGTLLAAFVSSDASFSLILLAIASCGYLFARKLDPPERIEAKEDEATKVKQSAWVNFKDNFIYVMKDKGLRLACLADAAFYTMGLLIINGAIGVGKHTLQAGEQKTSIILALLTLGIGLGTYLASLVRHSLMNRGLTSLGALLLAISLYFFSQVESVTAAYWLASAVGVSAGLFILPIKVYFQENAPIERLGSIISVNNFLTFSAMCLTSLGFVFLQRNEIPVSALGQLWACAGAAALIFVFSLFYIGDCFIRLLVFGVFGFIYRINIEGINNMPKEGPVLLMPNHVTWIDGFILSAAVPRKVCFMLDEAYYKLPVLNFFFKRLGFIPVPTGRKVHESLERAAAALDEGKVVCIFPEGRLSRCGKMNTFRRGYSLILDKCKKDVAVLPVHLGNAWQSIFHVRTDRNWKTYIPVQFPVRLELRLGEPMPKDAAPFEIMQKVKEMECENFYSSSNKGKTLPIQFLERIHRRPWTKTFSDATTEFTSDFSLAMGSFALSKRLDVQEDEKFIACLLPNVKATMAATMAIYFADAAPVFLNPTVSKEAIDYAVKKCSIKRLLTSRKLVEKLKVDLPDGLEIIYLEDLAEGISMMEKIRAGIKVLMPTAISSKLYFPKNSADVNATATVLFSSGSTGTPKGVELSHANFNYNTEAMQMICALRSSDCLLGNMPLFHCFGFLSALWIPLAKGIKTAMQSNPLEAAMAGKICEKHKVNILFGTPAFLNSYLRRCTGEQMKSLRLVISGADKLNAETAKAFEEKFGVLPMEAYGATEMSPSISINVPNDQKLLGKKVFAQAHVGRPLPGVATKVVNPDTYEELAQGEQGLLLVKSPGMMKGYYEDEERTEAAFHDGWYVTGDMAQLSPEGAIKLTGRMARFSKIGGEMVPHGAIEEALFEFLAEDGDSEVNLIVAAVPDKARGERILVLSEQELDATSLRKKMQDKGLPNLWIPRQQDFHQIETIPLLGTGKTDLKAVKEKALELDEKK